MQHNRWNCENVCVFADDENVQLVGMEASSAKKDESQFADENTGNSAVLASHGSVLLVNDTAITAEQHSFERCSCVENAPSVSPTHLTHCLLNSAVYTVVSSSSQVETMYKHNASRDSYRREGMNFHT